MLYKLWFLKKASEGFCGDAFKRPKKQKSINLNLNFLLSLSDLEPFSMPFTGNYVGKFAEVTMVNNDRYYIDEDSFIDLQRRLRQEGKLGYLTD